MITRRSLELFHCAAVFSLVRCFRNSSALISLNPNSVLENILVLFWVSSLCAMDWNLSQHSNWTVNHRFSSFVSYLSEIPALCCLMSCALKIIVLYILTNFFDWLKWENQSGPFWPEKEVYSIMFLILLGFPSCVLSWDGLGFSYIRFFFFFFNENPWEGQMEVKVAFQFYCGAQFKSSLPPCCQKTGCFIYL